MQSGQSPRARLRALLAGNRAVKMSSVFNPLSARIAQEIGSEAALMGGSLASHEVLGAPDLILITLTELAEQVGRCARASTVPIVVDGDHGYGNALNVMRAVQEMDKAGAGAVMIEDTELPRPYGPSGAARLISPEESAAKIRAAVAARGDSDIVVFGRTSAPGITGLDDAIARLKAFEDAGVDGLFLPGIGKRAELDAIAAATRLPLIIGAQGETADGDYLASRRVKLWSGGHQVYAVAAQALYDAMRAVHEGTPASKLPGIAPAALMDKLLDAQRYNGQTQSFLGGR